jgi:hypothetical protein
VALTDPSQRTIFRTALMKYLSDYVGAQVEAPFPMEGGVLEGPQDRHVGCVWFDTVRPHRSDANNEEAFFGIRLFASFKSETEPTAPIREKQEARLEWLFEVLEDALRAVRNRVELQAAVGADYDLSGWQDYFLIPEVTMNHPGQYVQATVVAQARSRVRRGG